MKQLLEERRVEWVGDVHEPYLLKSQAAALVEDLRALRAIRREEGKALRDRFGGKAAELASDFVYFIKCGEYVKIGYAYNVPGRLRDFRVGNPYPLELLAVVKGGRELEEQTQRRFRKYHHQGDWFHLMGELNAYISEIVELSPEKVPWVPPPRPSKFGVVTPIIDLNQRLSFSDRGQSDA